MMKKSFTQNIFRIALLAATITSGLHAHDDHTQSNLIPMGRLVLNPVFCDGRAAVGILGEWGRYVGRANGTVGYALTPNQNIKVGGEYLTQKLRYNFSDGHTRRWVQQWAVGGKYQAYFDYCYLKGIVLDGYYSNAPSKDLKRHQLSSTEVLHRRIAGSEAYAIEAGVLLTPWCGSSLSVLADYDNVKFKKRYESHREIQGFGITATFNQSFFNCFNLNLLAECRKPYNNYAADLLYTTNKRFGVFSGGLFGSYTQGKSKLPNVATAGLQFGISFGGRGQRNDPCCSTSCGEPLCYQNLATWVLEPAVYVPIVLAVRDQRSETVCAAPQALMPPAGFVDMGANVDTFDVTPFFTGSNLTWTAVSSNPATTVSINASGVMTLIPPITGIGTYQITVTATNSCGTAVGFFNGEWESA